MNNSDLPDSAIRARTGLQECVELIGSFRQVQTEAWRKLLGPLAGPLFASEEETRRHLSHEDARIRFVALSMMVDHWKARAPHPFVERCEQMALSDPDAKIRGAALTYLGVCYHSTNDRRLGRVLATIVRSEDESTETRWAAYRSLVAISVPRSVPGQRPSSIGWRLEQSEQFDWKLVDGFLD